MQSKGIRVALYSAVVPAALLLAALVAKSPIAAVLILLLPCLLWMTIRSPRFALCMWFIGLCSIPHWLSIHVIVAWPPGSLLGLLVLPSLLVHRRRDGFRLADRLVMIYVLSFCTAFEFVGAPKNIVAQVFVQGGIAYLIGRHLAPSAGKEWTVRMVSCVLSLIGVWAIGEYIFSFHPFVGLDPGSPEAFWSALQTRGGHVRSEAAFGHAIALGAALAAGIPF